MVALRKSLETRRFEIICLEMPREYRDATGVTSLRGGEYSIDWRIIIVLIPFRDIVVNIMLSYDKIGVASYDSVIETRLPHKVDVVISCIFCYIRFESGYYM